MDSSGIYVGLDIGTTSIKIIIAEYVKKQLNIIGYGNTRSAGLNRGVIVDIDQTVGAIRMLSSRLNSGLTLKFVT